MHRSRATQQGCLITGGVCAVRSWVVRDLSLCVCVSEMSPSGSLFDVEQNSRTVVYSDSRQDH